jgi:lactoylglutathione lyase
MADQVFPILEAADIERSLRFWRDGIGGVVAFSWPGPAGEPAYVGLDVGAAHLGIGGPSDARWPAGERRPIALWVYVEDVDDIVERLRAAGTTVTAEPEDQPWGERIARVLDPDGNEVVLGQRAVAG